MKHRWSNVLQLRFTLCTVYCNFQEYILLCLEIAFCCEALYYFIIICQQEADIKGNMAREVTSRLMETIDIQRLSL